MNIAVYTRAILTRLQADTGSGGLYESSAWNPTIIPGGFRAIIGSITTAQFPYGVYQATASADHDLQGDEWEVTTTFTIYDNIDRGTDRLEQVIDRLVGDALLSSGARTVPTYGFNRHTLALPSTGSTNVQGFTGGTMIETSQEYAAVDENILAATVSFQGRVSRTATNQ